MHYTLTRVRTGRVWLWLAISVIILLLASSAAAGQGRNAYYLAVGPAFTSNSDWGEGHKVGYAAEIGVIRTLSPSWDLVGALAIEAFEARLVRSELEYLELYDPPSAEKPVFSHLQGGDDRALTVWGGVRRMLIRTGAFRPYAAVALGISASLQDRAYVDRTIELEEGSQTTTIILQDNNGQMGAGFSGLLGVSARLQGFGLLFFESGYTYVYTPDDSVDDNPAFFPLRVGVIF